MDMTRRVKKMPDVSTLAEAIEFVERLGYTHEFVPRQEGLKDLATGKIYRAEQLAIRDVYRFEGFTDPDDLSVLFVLEADDGVRGWVSDAFGPYASPLLATHLERMKYEPIDED